MATVLNEVAAMIATEVNRLIRMSGSRENLRSVNTRKQTAGDDHVKHENRLAADRDVLVANRDVNATLMRHRMEQQFTGRRIGPIGR
jgi:hypothetical protein